MESTAGTCPEILEGILWKEAIKDHRSEQPVAATLVGLRYEGWMCLGVVCVGWCKDKPFKLITDRTKALSLSIRY